MENDGVEITIEDYDENHVIAFVEKCGKSMLLIFGLYDFAENMEFWGINVTYGNKDGREGLIFENMNGEMARLEIKQFINQYNLAKYELWGAEDENK